MGKILECRCNHCKYSVKKLFLGSGKMRGKGYFPAFDSRTKSVVQIETDKLVEIVDQKELVINADVLNAYKKEDKTPYFDKGMFRWRLFSGKPISGSPLYLQSKFNRCPQCNRYRLRFEFVGLFD